MAALVEGKVTPRLSSLLESIKDEKKASLAVADPKLGTCHVHSITILVANISQANAINKLPQLSLNLISDSTTTDLYRSIRNHLPSLIPGLLPEDISTMSLGLSHSLSRHKLKFSPDKVDTMIVQAISLLDDLDKELNTYAMRVKEWYGWHFPEMGRILNDNLAYARVIRSMGMRTHASKTDLSDILPEEIETAVKAAAEVSMGTEITSDDLDNIQSLAEQVIEFTEYRALLSGYLSARMAAIAPNLTALVGDLVGARLIAHAGSLMNLAKSPASTVQILGAEKALFRALKTKHDTPKYGLLYHASLVGQATGKNKGKIARMLATKATLGLRVDALADWSAEGEGKGDNVTEEERSALGVANRSKIERRLANLEGRPLRSKGVNIAPNSIPVTPGKWEVKEARKYNPDADGLDGDEPAAGMPAKKNSRTESQSDAKMIDAVEEKKAESEKGKDFDEDSFEDKDDDPKPHAPGKANGTAKVSAIETSSDSDGSADELDPPSPPPQDEKALKEALKKEKREKKIALLQERSQRKIKKAKLAQKSEQKEKKDKRAEPMERQGKEDERRLRELAKEAGLPISRYKRKLERGEIKFDAEGRPEAISKKDIKKARKAAEKAEAAAKLQASVKTEKIKEVEVDVAANGTSSSSKRSKRDVEEAIIVEKTEKKKVGKAESAEEGHAKKRKRDDDGAEEVDKLEKKKKSKKSKA